MKSRSELLEELAIFKTPRDTVLKELKIYGWDSENSHFTLTNGHVLSILDRFLSSELTAIQLEEWAECFEAREDIKYENKELSEVIFQLANPAINYPITIDLINNIKRNLTSRSS